MSTRGRLAFATMSLVWGASYLFIKLGVDGGLEPAFLAWARLVIAAALLGALAWRAGTLPALRGRGRWLVLYAICELSIPFPLIAFGEQRVASSLAAILIATVPLIIAAMAIRFVPSERVTGRRLAGLFVGLAGVVVLMGIDVAGRASELVGAGAILVAALGYATGPLIFNRHLLDLDARAVMSACLAIAGAILTPLAALDAPTHAPTTKALIALVVLAVVCTAAAFVVFGTLIAEVGPSRASVITYVNPVVAVALGIAFLGERPGTGAVVGLVAIIVGSWVATGGAGARDQAISTSTPSRLSSKLTRPWARNASGSGDS
jgi:drug/metabolite transporter (DMT)-like permease